MEKLYTYNKISHTAREWSEYLNISTSTFYDRVSHFGLTDKTFTKNKRRKLYAYNGASLTARQWSNKLGITPGAFSARIKAYGENDPRVYSPNTRAKTSKTYSYGGQTHTARAWSELLNLSLCGFQRRLLLYGLGDPRTFSINTANAHPGKKFTHNGVSLTARQWSNKLGISQEAFYVRVRKYGANSDKVYDKSHSTIKHPQRYTYQNTSLTARQWAEKCHVTLNAWYSRKRRYGERDPRTYQVYSQRKH